MIQNERLQRAIKALLLIGLGFFLYSKIANGTLYFYISERYSWLTMIAFIGLIIVGLSYRRGPDAQDHNHHDHAHHDHHHDHNHGLTWSGAFLVALPILLGILVPPQPLGASALATREINIGGADSVMPSVVRRSEQKAAIDRNILDWVTAFRMSRSSGERFDGVEANLVGFVYREANQAEGTFWLARFIVGCCVADASPAAVLVRSSLHGDFEDGDWVRVDGRFHTEVGAQAPVLMAETVDLIPAPNQPYLYP
ncbi:MAG: TIGR03943 family protein [Caldilineaceae bacterium]|nr:TIGR03943 family protein [Caldilineaceae bacterium]